MALTLNQVIKRLETLSENHRQINHFFFGKPDEWLNNGEVTYPAFFCDVLSAQVNRTDRLTYYRFTLWFQDQVTLVNNASENEQELLSDLSSIAQDILAMMYDPELQDGENGWEIDEVVPMTFHNITSDDVCVAVSLELNIATRFSANRCQVPLNLGDFNNDINNDFNI